MKKYIISLVIASVFLISAPFAVNQASAADMSIRDFINLLVAIGVITPDKLPAVNAYLSILDDSSDATIKPVTCSKDLFMCPAGDRVGRTGNKCEFVCPGKPLVAPRFLSLLNIKKGSYGGYTSRENIIINDKESLLNVWSKNNIGGKSLPPIDVDFSKQSVVAIFAGNKSNGCYGIEVSEIQEYDRKFVIKIDNISAGKNCICTSAVTQPFHIIATSKMNKEVEFVDDYTSTNCGE